jgi:rhodanese-related sulfurtransferase/SAM-dependent methyltransferase
VEELLSAARSRLRRVSPGQARELQHDGGLLVDIRPEWQRRDEGAIPGALVVERTALEWRMDPRSQERLIDRYDLPVVVICSSGRSSSLAAACLQDLGLRHATDLVGGVLAWRRDGLPVERTGPPDPAEVLGEQREYYQQRAADYDAGGERVRQRMGPEVLERWQAEVDEVAAALDTLDPRGDLLELASGTGAWSRLLAPRADRLTLVDGAAQMHAHNPVAAAPNVRTIVADLFEWDTDERFDGVSFGFWLSHVPDGLLDGFLAKVARWVRPGGSLFYVDSHPLTGHRAPVAGGDAALQRRRLADGREFTIVKAFRAPGELSEAMHRAGFAVQVRETPSYFQYATGLRTG